MHKSALTILLIATFSAAPLACGCDLCGCYTPQLETSPQATADVVFGQFTGVTGSSGRSWITGLYGAASEQFTYFGTIQVDGHEEANPTGQHLDSSITQLVAGYTFNSRFALQMNLPLIYRSFERPEGFAIDRGTESGLGDISLLAKFVAYHTEIASQRTRILNGSQSLKVEIPELDFTASVVLLAGVKFPTGDSSRIREEFNEVEVPGAPESGIHGHDLTLGTGSYDGILSGQTSLRYKNWFFQGDLQFTLRGDGLHKYHFANDLFWSGGPGYYFIRRHNAILGLQFVVSGEHKDVDRFRGQPAEDTGITSLFLGPRLIAGLGRISAEIAVDLPASIDNTALQVVPDYRIRGGIAIRF